MKKTLCILWQKNNYKKSKNIITDSLRKPSNKAWKGKATRGLVVPWSSTTFHGLIILEAWAFQAVNGTKSKEVFQMLLWCAYKWFYA